MNCTIFLGPSLPEGEAAEVLSARYQPPVAQGDIVTAVREGATVIGIVDGYFEGTLAVWHKEILWAMENGVHVFGGASMGALRAAELAPFDMVGVGTIFKAYREGELVDDDEVAVVHYPARTGYRLATEAMVNVRATLERAVVEQIISPETQQTLVDTAKQTFYKHRDYDYHWLETAEGAQPDEVEAYKQWIPGGRVDVKRSDALAMLNEIRHFRSTRPTSKQTDYRLAYTEMWDAVIRRPQSISGTSWLEDQGISWREILNEIRLDPELHRQCVEAANLRRLGLSARARSGVSLPTNALEQTDYLFRSRRGLLQTRDLDSWLFDRGLTRRDYQRLLREQAELDLVATLLTPEQGLYLLDYLRWDGPFETVVNRAKRKQALVETNTAIPRSDSAGSENEIAVDLWYLGLERWYFEKRLEMEPPDDVEGFALKLGFESRVDFRAALLAEHLFVNPAE